MKIVGVRLCVLLMMLALMACHDSTVGTPVFHAQEKPPRLSDWNVLRVDGNTLMLADRVVSYDLNTPLFSDYAHKLRTVWMPEGSSAKYRETESFEFPVGTIISKTFYYPTGGSQSSASNRVMKTSNSSTNTLFSVLTYTK